MARGRLERRGLLPDRGWGGDRDAWDRAYLPGLAVPTAPYAAAYRERSDAARRWLPWRELRYGPDPAERIQFFDPGRSGAPLLVFVHGGYWLELTLAESAFAARDAAAAGMAFAALHYGLAPEHRLDDIVRMARRGLRRLYRDAAALGVDPARIVVAGHSAGAQLVAMCLDEPGASAVVLLSGLYELAPLCHTSVGAAMGLTAAEAARNSPVRRLPRDVPPVLMVRGGDEPVGFADQQACLRAALDRRSATVDELVVAGRNHFELPLGLCDPADPVGRAVLALAGAVAVDADA